MLIQHCGAVNGGVGLRNNAAMSIPLMHVNEGGQNVNKNSSFSYFMQHAVKNKVLLTLIGLEISASLE